MAIPKQYEHYVDTELEVRELTARGVPPNIATEIVDVRGSLSESEIESIMRGEAAAQQRAAARAAFPSTGGRAPQINLGPRPATPPSTARRGEAPPEFVKLDDAITRITQRGDQTVAQHKDQVRAGLNEFKEALIQTIEGFRERREERLRLLAQAGQTRLQDGVVIPRTETNEAIAQAEATARAVQQIKNIGNDPQSSPEIRQTIKDDADVTATMLIPGYWAKDWDQYSNTMKGINIVLDAIVMLPILNAVRGVKVTPKARAKAPVTMLIEAEANQTADLVSSINKIYGAAGDELARAYGNMANARTAYIDAYWEYDRAWQLNAEKAGELSGVPKAIRDAETKLITAGQELELAGNAYAKEAAPLMGFDSADIKPTSGAGRGLVESTEKAYLDTRLGNAVDPSDAVKIKTQEIANLRNELSLTKSANEKARIRAEIAKAEDDLIKALDQLKEENLRGDWNPYDDRPTTTLTKPKVADPPVRGGGLKIQTAKGANYFVVVRPAPVPGKILAAEEKPAEFEQPRPGEISRPAELEQPKPGESSRPGESPAAKEEPKPKPSEKGAPGTKKLGRETEKAGAQPEAEPQPKPEPTPKPIKAPTKTAETTKKAESKAPKPRPNPRPRGGAPEKKVRKYISQSDGAIAWRQGKVWAVMVSPYESEDDLFVLSEKRRPAGAQVFEGKGSAFKTIQRLRGTKTPKDDTTVDWGFVDYKIDVEGRKLTLSAQADPKGLTRSKFNISSRFRPKLTQRSKIKITPKRARLGR